MEREWQEESLEAGLAAEAPAAGQTVDVHAPQGPLGLVFQRESTVLSRMKQCINQIVAAPPLLNHYLHAIDAMASDSLLDLRAGIKDSSPLLHKVQVGWTLVSVDGQDVSRMDGWAVTKVISARMHDPDGRWLKFKTDETVAAGKALPAEAAGEALPEVEPAAPATSMAAAAGARADID